MRKRSGGQSFDHGVVELIEEPRDAPWPADDRWHFTQDRMQWPQSWAGWPWP